MTFLAMDNAFNEISKALRYNEFRRLLWKGQTECYQFIKPLSNLDTKNHKNGSLQMTTWDILQYSRNRAHKQSAEILNGNQVKNRSARETKWKKWYENRISKEEASISTKREFIEENVEKLQLNYGDRLLDFQREHVRNLLACLNIKGVALDASDTGTGKTYSALCLAKELGLIPIIVCPKSIIPGWKRAMAHFNIKEFFVSNYEQYRSGNTKWVKRKGVNPTYRNFGTGKKKHEEENTRSKSVGFFGSRERSEKQYKDNLGKIPKIEYDWKLDPDKHFLIFDECHKTKNTSTLNYAIYWWAREKHNENGLKILSLSATVADKIVNAYAICYMLGLVKDGGEFNTTYNLNLNKGMLKDFGYEVTNNGFYRFNQKYTEIKDRLQKEDTNLKKLHDDLFPMNGARMVISDLGDSFPENFVQAQTYDMDRRAGQIEKIYKEMEKDLEKLEHDKIEDRRAELERLERKDVEELTEKELIRMQTLRLKWGKSIDSCATDKEDFEQDEGESRNHLAVMMKARQRVELLKADTLIELAGDFLEQGKSVVIFVNFIQTMEYCQKAFNGKNGISIIRGGQSEDERQEQIDAFQDNRNNLAIVTMGSGRESISLHDLDGQHPRVSLISPSFSAQDLIQALGRIHRAEGKTKCLQYLIFCAGTVEDRICEIVQQKIHNINTINDGDLQSGFSIR